MRKAESDLAVFLDAVRQEHSVQRERKREDCAVPDRRACRRRAQRGPFPPGYEQIERGDRAVQYEPFGAQLHEYLYHAAVRPHSRFLMLDQLTTRLARVVKTMRGQARLTEDNMQEMLREVRVALLEADVALPVVRDFIVRIREKALGEEVVGSLTP